MEGRETSGVILSALGFNASLVALLLAAQGYVAGRLVPAGARLLWHRHVLWIVPGMLRTYFGIYMLAKDFRELTKAASHSNTASVCSRLDQQLLVVLAHCCNRW
jgi:hypothetical protein